MPENDWEPFRAYLKELLRDATVRTAIQQRTAVSARTLARWVSGETEEPDRKRLTSLLQALPQYRDPLLSTITKALPDFAPPMLDTTNSLVENLPLDFWIRLAEAHATTPKNIRFMVIVNLLFLPLQATIDPERIGLHLIIAVCSPPRAPDEPVPSLREIVRIKTHGSLLKSSGYPLFLGAESLCGYSVSSCMASIVQNVHQERRLPVLHLPEEESAAAYPIQRGGSVAGCFLVSSPQPDFFTQRLQDLLQLCAYLLTLAFETDEFYAPERIRLRPMPTMSVQNLYIVHFQERVLSLLHDDSSLSRDQTERIVWQQIEEALLTHPSDRQEETSGDQRRS